MSMGLTPKQARCLAAIRALSGDGITPSFEEVRSALGLKSKSSVKKLVDGLEERGAVTRTGTGYRTIQVVDQKPLVPVRPAIHSMAERYARTTGTTVEAVTNEALAAYLGAA